MGFLPPRISGSTGHLSGERDSFILVQWRLNKTRRADLAGDAEYSCVGCALSRLQGPQSLLLSADPLIR